MQLQAATQSIPSPSQKAPSRGPPRGFSGPKKAQNLRFPFSFKLFILPLLQAP